MDKEIEIVLDRIMGASSDSVIRRYESKVEQLERQRAGLVEKVSNQGEAKGTYAEKLELVLKFLSTPWNLWDNGDIHVRRMVLKLAFTSPVYCTRNEGARTPDLSIPLRL
ncbi:MAG: hypothetical protein R8G34_15970 [Paracoccaceae bacterium]|nr:hypothetical protein [Paracoccaceae bacterium]